MILSPTKQNEIQEVAKLKRADLSFEDIGQRLGFSERTARRRYQAYQIQRDVALNGYHVPEEEQMNIKRFNPLTRTGDCIISCDWHIPLHDPVIANKLIDKARTEGIKNLVVGGDFLNLDSFSHYLPHQPEADFIIEREMSNDIMKALLKTFDEIDFIWGNHEHRISKFTNFKYSFETLMRWIFNELDEDEHKRLRISDLDYMFYKPNDKVYRVCHPANFSKIPLTVPRQLAQKYGTSIITAHSHHCAIGIAPDGHNIIIDGGGLFDKNKTEYIQRTTTHHEWVQGFTLFKDSVPYLLSPAFGNM